MYYTLFDFLQDRITPEIKLLTREMDFQKIRIESISVQELPVDNFIQKNELVLSTAIGCLNHADAFRQLIREVGEARAAAMILTFKDVEEAIPPDIVAYADAMSLPLFVIPWEYRFSDIQSAVIQNIQSKKLEIYKEIQTSLFNLFFDSQDLENAADLISAFLGLPVSVEDKSYRPLCRSARGRRLADEEAVCFREETIRIGDTPVGYLRLYEPEEPLGQSEKELIEGKDLIQKFLCFPLSLWFNRKNIEDVVEARLKNDFVWNLANKNYTSLEEMAAQGVRLHFDLGRPYTCIILKAVSRMEDGAAQEYSNESAVSTTAMEALIVQAGKAQRLGIMVADRSLEFIIYLENQGENPTVSVDRFLADIESQLKRSFPAYAFYWGISEITCKAPNFSQLYKNAMLALRYCMNSNQKRYRFTYQDTREAQIISLLSSDKSIQKMAAETIGALREYDSGSGINLMGTLIEFINCNYNTSLTARNLHIHRQSLLYRLGKIESLTEMSLSSHKDLFILEVYTRIFSNY